MTPQNPRDDAPEEPRAALPNLAAMAWPELASDQGPHKVLYALRREALTQVARALQADGSRALLVKGGALAETLYPTPWSRPMADLDFIVPAAELTRVCAALERAGFVRGVAAGRPLTEASLEIQLRSPGPLGSTLVEVHVSLDKVVPRRVDDAALFARASALPGYSNVLVPSREDHVLLIALHLAASEWNHLPGFVDLELLLSADLDLELVAARAREWHATIPLYVTLEAVNALCPGLVPERVTDELAPSPARTALLSTRFAIGSYPVAHRPTELGWPLITGQTLLREDTLRWTLGVGAYMAKRLLERMVLRGR